MFVVLMFYKYLQLRFFSASVLPDKLEGLDSCPRSCKYLMYPFGRWTSETGWKPDVKGSQYTANQYIFTVYSTFYVLGFKTTLILKLNILLHEILHELPKRRYINEFPDFEDFLFIVVMAISILPKYQS